jgi:hypothetical protein
VEPGDFAVLRLEVAEAVVLDFPVPEEAFDGALNLRELAEEPAGEVDEVDALVEHLAAAGDVPLPPPLLLHAEPAALPVAAADEHHLAERAGVEQLSRFA